jgi:hypothetical protein
MAIKQKYRLKNAKEFQDGEYDKAYCIHTRVSRKKSPGTLNKDKGSVELLS